MTRMYSTVPLRAQPASDSPEPALLDPLLRLAGDIRSTHALIVADHGLDLMCGLIRRGCPAASILRIGDKADANDYGLVLIPHATAFSSIEEVVKLARRSLAPRGRLIVGVPTGTAAIALARRLRLNGFTNLRSTHLSGLMLLRVDLRSLVSWDKQATENNGLLPCFAASTTTQNL